MAAPLDRSTIHSPNITGANMLPDVMMQWREGLRADSEALLFILCADISETEKLALVAEVVNEICRKEEL